MLNNHWQDLILLGGGGHTLLSVAAKFGWMDLLKYLSDVEKIDPKGKYVYYIIIIVYNNISVRNLFVLCTSLTYVRKHH